jgi:hypothetical protein
MDELRLLIVAIVLVIVVLVILFAGTRGMTR